MVHLQASKNNTRELLSRDALVLCSPLGVPYVLQLICIFTNLPTEERSGPRASNNDLNYMASRETLAYLGCEEYLMMVRADIACMNAFW